VIRQGLLKVTLNVNAGRYWRTGLFIHNVQPNAQREPSIRHLYNLRLTKATTMKQSNQQHANAKEAMPKQMYEAIDFSEL